MIRLKRCDNLLYRTFVLVSRGIDNVAVSHFERVAHWQSGLDTPQANVALDTPIQAVIIPTTARRTCRAIVCFPKLRVKELSVGPLPKRKLSRRRKFLRRQHDRISLSHLVRCENCNEYKPAHQVCPKCGTYNGRQVLDIEEKE
jgi:large subunit ribosomal protein L32